MLHIERAVRPRHRTAGLRPALAFNEEQDPREESDITTNNLWLLEPCL